MDDARLAEVRRDYCGARFAQCSRCNQYLADVPLLLSALRDALDLLGRVACDERHAAEVGAARERGAVAEWLHAANYPRLASDVRARGPCLPALPAEALAAENGRLRALLRQARDELRRHDQEYAYVTTPGLRDAIDATLGEGG
jgi:hypothetical protein